MFSNFQTVNKVVFGSGCVARLGEEVRKLGCARVGLITDKGLTNAGIHISLVASLNKSGVSCSIYDQAALDPTPESIEQSSEWVKKNDIDVLLGLGGGSSMDTTKATALLASHDGPLSQYFGLHKVQSPCLPIIQVPTTAGTGSEMTSNAVLNDPITDSKQGIVSDYLYAKLVLLDPELTLGLPPFYTAITGMDAIVHSMESYTSQNATFFTDALNVQALRMLIGSIRKAYSNGQDRHAREQMLYGAAASGIAFSNTQNGIIHAIGMSFSHEHNIPHGLMMAICAPMGMAFNAIAEPEKYAVIAEILGSAPARASIMEKAKSAAKGFEELMRDLDIEPGLGVHGIRKDEIRPVAEKAAAYKRLMDSNARKGTADELERLMEHFY